MPDTFDPYREALVMETQTLWDDSVGTLDPETRSKLAAAVHHAPEKASHLEYIRTHTGFCRQITVTAADIQRLKG